MFANTNISTEIIEKAKELSKSSKEYMKSHMEMVNRDTNSTPEERVVEYIELLIKEKSNSPQQ